jgi:ABC-type branched-subunit amino acid transport system substrate-binding protein
MRGRRKGLLAVAAGVALVAVACGGSSSKAKAGGGQTYTIGVITDATGLAASGNKTSVQGVQAGQILAKRDGYTIKYVVGDTATSPASALTAAQRLVEQSHVLAVLTVSAVFFGAAPYLTAQGVPVVGAAEDGTEWLHSRNMFASYGPIDPTKVTDGLGQFFKMEGVTSVGALGYSVSPSSSDVAKGAALSAQAVGLKVGYLDANFPFGSTNVQPVALAMKNNGVNGFFAVVDPNTGLELVTALRQEGVDLKAALLPTGYGGDLIQGGAAGIRAAQGVFFTSTFEPVEMHTAATEQFQADLRAVGVATEPTYAEYSAYAAMSLLVDGLEAAGKNPTQASLISGLSSLKAFDANGLLGVNKVDMTLRSGPMLGVPRCGYITKLVGTTFQLVPGATPGCGAHLVPGKTVSASS